MRCEHMPIDMPDLFPGKQFDRFMDSSKVILLPDKGQPWQEFVGASNLIAWRFRACIDYFGEYRSSKQQFAGGTGFDRLYNQERYWFGAFVAGVSCVDSVTYAIYALASHSAVLDLNFGVKEQRGCSPKNLAQALGPGGRAAPAVTAINKMLASDDWTLWRDLRNRMMHRSNLPRVIRGSIGSAPPKTPPIEYGATSSTQHVEGDESWIDMRCQWLSQHIAALLESGTHLAQGHRANGR